MSTTRRPRPTFTTSAFVRSAGRQPRGTGTWAFQQTRTSTAFSGELFGEVEFVTGTLTEAKREVAGRFPGGALVAVLG